MRIGRGGSAAEQPAPVHCLSMVRYFAYGSNLDFAQMRRRCPSSRVVGRAWLPGYRVTFPRPCESWGGGVAGIEPAAGHDAHGVVYELCDEDLATLDDYEGVADGDYDRREVEVHCEAGGTMRVWTYFANPQPGCPPPSRRYLDAIVRGARYHRLPGAYVERLAATPICDENPKET